MRDIPSRRLLDGGGQLPTEIVAAYIQSRKEEIQEPQQPPKSLTSKSKTTTIYRPADILVKTPPKNEVLQYITSPEVFAEARARRHQLEKHLQEVRKTVNHPRVSARGLNVSKEYIGQLVEKRVRGEPSPIQKSIERYETTLESLVSRVTGPLQSFVEEQVKSMKEGDILGNIGRGVAASLAAAAKGAIEGAASLIMPSTYTSLITNPKGVFESVKQQISKPFGVSELIGATAVQIMIGYGMGKAVGKVFAKPKTYEMIPEVSKAEVKYVTGSPYAKYTLEYVGKAVKTKAAPTPKELTVLRTTTGKVIRAVKGGKAFTYIEHLGKRYVVVETEALKKPLFRAPKITYKAEIVAPTKNISPENILSLKPKLPKPSGLDIVPTATKAGTQVAQLTKTLGVGQPKPVTVKAPPMIGPITPTEVGITLSLTLPKTSTKESTPSLTATPKAKTTTATGTPITIYRPVDVSVPLSTPRGGGLGTVPDLTETIDLSKGLIPVSYTHLTLPTN